MAQIIELDLHKQRLFGFEPYKSLRVVEKMLRLIESGVPFDPVPIDEIDGGDFMLSTTEWRDNLVDGGHHRAIAHYIAEVPLPCIIREKMSRISFEWLYSIPISGCSLWIENQEICRVDQYRAGKAHSDYTPDERCAARPLCGYDVLTFTGVWDKD